MFHLLLFYFAFLSTTCSNSGSRISSRGEDCSCADVKNRLAFLERQFIKYKDQEEIRQLVWGWSYEFDNWFNGDSTVNDYVSWLRKNTIEELSATAGELFTFNSREEFIATVITLDSLGYYLNHFIAATGIQFIEYTGDYAKVRQNWFNTGLQSDFNDNSYKQINVGEAPRFEFRKIDGKWLFTSIISLEPSSPCLIGSPNMTAEECLVTLQTLKE